MNIKSRIGWLWLWLVLERRRGEGDDEADRSTELVIDEEGDKAISGSAVACGFGLLGMALSALFLFQPEKQLSEGRTHSSHLTSDELAHVGSLAANYLSLIFGLILLYYHTWNPAPSPNATIIKKTMTFIGLSCLALGLLSRTFICLPTPYRQPVTVAVMGGGAMCALPFGLTNYYCILRPRRERNLSLPISQLCAQQPTREA